MFSCDDQIRNYNLFEKTAHKMYGILLFANEKIILSNFEKKREIYRKVFSKIWQGDKILLFSFDKIFFKREWHSPFRSVLIITISLSDPVFLAWLPSVRIEKKFLVVRITATFSFTALVMADRYSKTDRQSSLPEWKQKEKLKDLSQYYNITNR